MSQTKQIVVRIDGKRHSLRYVAGDTLLEAVRRAGHAAPFSCQQGNCGTCMAFVAEGEVHMRANHVLDADEVAEGWVLTCQGVPTSPEVVLDYDR